MILWKTLIILNGSLFIFILLLLLFILLFQLIIIRITDEGTSLFEKFGWIPNTILKLIYTDDKDILYVT